jgi:hypothetical protein
MKKVFLMLSVVLTMLFVTGCATGFPNGLIYTKLDMPIAVNSSDKGEIGTLMTSEVEGVKILGLVVCGDTSYKAAVDKVGGFKRVQRVEYFSEDILGCGYFGIRVIGEPVDASAGEAQGAVK